MNAVSHPLTTPIHLESRWRPKHTFYFDDRVSNNLVGMDTLAEYGKIKAFGQFHSDAYQRNHFLTGDEIYHRNCEEQRAMIHLWISSALSAEEFLREFHFAPADFVAWLNFQRIDIWITWSVDFFVRKKKFETPFLQVLPRQHGKTLLFRFTH